MSNGLRARDRTTYQSWTNSHQIDDREQPNPDDVERVPEQGKAEQTAPHGGAKALDCDLRHHRRQPDQSGGDVQPVAPDKGEERGKKRAALRRGTAGDHVGELAHLKIKKRGTEYES